MRRDSIAKLMVGLVVAATASALAAQDSFTERLTAHNARMNRWQPAMISPIATTDPRLIQYARFSVAHSYTPSGTETVNYGNARGGGLIVNNRLEIDWLPPDYVVHNSAAKDGPTDTSVLGKLRVASGNAEHGNYDVAVLVAHCFATGSYKNGAATDSFAPTLAAAKTMGRWDVVSALGGTMPTGKIATQGRTINWNALVQWHATRHLWLETENNATFYFAGSHDGRMQNFVTPGALYVVRNSEWASTHPFVIVDAGMQIATSGFHTYNHNLIAETRLIF